MLKQLSVFVFVLATFSILSGGAAQANEGPSVIFPDPDDTCNLDLDPTGPCFTPRPLYLAVGAGEHTSNDTASEIYAYASGNVTIRIHEGRKCNTTAGNHANQSLDFGLNFTTRFFVRDITNGFPGTAVGGNFDVAPCSNQNSRTVDITRFLTNGRTYQIVARALSPTISSENLYRLQVIGGNALLGAGRSNAGGLSIANRDLPAGWGSTYAFHFGVGCGAITGENRIRVFDDDFGRYQTATSPSGNITYPDLRYSVFQRARGSGAPWGAPIASGVSNGGQGTFDAFGNVIGGWDTWATVSAGNEYRVAISGLTRPNALEVDLPTSASQRLLGESCVTPTDYDGSADVDCTRATGWFGDRNNISVNNYDVRVRSRLVGEATWRVNWDESVSDATPTSPIAGNHGYFVNIPAASQSQTLDTEVQVHAFSNDRSTLLYTLSGTTNEGVCTPATTWDYDINLTATGTSTLRANDNFSVGSRVNNAGNDTGAVYTQRTRVIPAGNNLLHAGRSVDVTTAPAPPNVVVNNGSAKQVLWANNPALASGGNRTRIADYQIRNNPTHNDSFCFRSTVLPAGGNSSPTLTTTDAQDRTDDSEGTMYERCINIYNRRFALNIPNVVEPTIAFPGETVTFAVTIFNNGGPPNNATGGPVGVDVPINVTGSQNGTVTAGGNFNIPQGTAFNTGSVGPVDVDVLVDSGVSPGDDLCIEVERTIPSGYSDADRSADAGSKTNEFCVVITERPYFVVQNHDVWAGAVWDETANPCGTVANTEGDIQSVFANITTDISGTPTPTNYGSFGEYAAYAIQSITGFGARAAGLDSLTFSNEDRPDYGNILGSADPTAMPPEPAGSAPPQCIPDYFGELFDSSATGGNINSVTGGSSTGMYYLSGNQTFNSGSDVEGRRTAVIDGDLYIRNDINYGDFAYDSTTDTLTGPSLAVIVLGNIYVDDDVEELNGFFVAQRRADGTGGIFDTCSSALGTPMTALSTTVCDEQLIINGAVTAEYLHLRRTHGGIVRDFNRLNGGNPRLGGAEEIRFNPMMYSHPPFFDTVGGPQGNEFPFQQIKDLPPIF